MSERKKQCLKIGCFSAWLVLLLLVYLSVGATSAPICKIRLIRHNCFQGMAKLCHCIVQRVSNLIKIIQALSFWEAPEYVLHTFARNLVQARAYLATRTILQHPFVLIRQFSWQIWISLKNGLFVSEVAIMQEFVIDIETEGCFLAERWALAEAEQQLRNNRTRYPVLWNLQAPIMIARCYNSL